MYVRLLVPYYNCKPGDVINLPATEARQLLNDHKAHGGNINISNVKPVDYTKPAKQIKPARSVQVITPRQKPKPTADNTVKEIKKWLDEQNVSYSARSKKSDLLKLVN